MSRLRNVWRSFACYWTHHRPSTVLRSDSVNSEERCCRCGVVGLRDSHGCLFSEDPKPSYTGDHVHSRWLCFAHVDCSLHACGEPCTCPSGDELKYHICNPYFDPTKCPLGGVDDARPCEIERKSHPNHVGETVESMHPYPEPPA